MTSYMTDVRMEDVAAPVCMCVCVCAQNHIARGGNQSFQYCCKRVSRSTATRKPTLGSKSSQLAMLHQHFTCPPSRLLRGHATRKCSVYPELRNPAHPPPPLAADVYSSLSDQHPVSNGGAPLKLFRLGRHNLGLSHATRVDKLKAIGLSGTASKV